jgi:peptidoglycan hydrolase-like protein with peptidoglycan-binding domain
VSQNPAIGIIRLHLTTDAFEGEITISAPQADTQVTLSLPILRRGQHSGEPPVERLQFMLNFVKGVDDLDVDGIFGPKTEAAVRDFQQNENLAVDGIVGKQTWTALLRRWLLFSQPG